MSKGKRVAKIVASYLILILAMYFLLMPGGIGLEYAYKYLGLDVSYTVPYLMVILSLLLSSKLSVTLTERKIGNGISILLGGLALLILVFLFFDVKYPDNVGINPYYHLLLWLCDFRRDYSSLRFFTVLGVIGITLARGGRLIPHKEGGRIISGISLTILAYALLNMSLLLSANVGTLYLGSIERFVVGPFKIWERVDIQIGLTDLSANVGTLYLVSIERFVVGPFKIWERADIQISLTDIWTSFFAGLLAVAFALFISCGASAKNTVVSKICNWFSISQLRNFMIGAFLGSYLLIIRPIIMAMFPYAPLIEWGIAGLMVTRAYSGLKSEIGKKYTVSYLKEVSWRKHVQKITYREDEDFENANELQRIFVEDGEKGPLLVHLTLLLSKNGFKTDEIIRILEPLINYEDEKIPTFAFGWEKRRVLKRNWKTREKLLNDLMITIRSWSFDL